MSDAGCYLAPMRYQTTPFSLDQLRDLLHSRTTPVVLLEGTRDVPDTDAPKLTALGCFLAKEFPHARFRSGNAEGSDTLFARGVEAVDPGRMEIVTPTPGHRKKNLHPDNYVIPLNKVSAAHEHQLALSSNAATPANRNLIEKRHQVPRLGAKAKYLLRDTLKVLGDADNGLAPATIGFFYTKPDPMAGGTGHTIRVCLQEQIPTVLFECWATWLGQ